MLSFLLGTSVASLLGNMLAEKGIVRPSSGNRVVYSRNNLPQKIKDGTYVINLDKYADLGTHWFALFCKKWNCLFR